MLPFILHSEPPAFPLARKYSGRIHYSSRKIEVSLNSRLSGHSDAQFTNDKLFFPRQGHKSISMQLLHKNALGITARLGLKAWD